jgi:hypothetical protein
MDKTTAMIFVCISIVLLSVIYAIMNYNINEKNLMAQNIDNAISKGVDPLSVRCSYASYNDTICVAYAASSQDKSVALVK